MLKSTGKPLRHAVSVVIREPGGRKAVLAVLRPPDDPDLPGLWGLPAGSVRPGEGSDEAVLRAGREKLGVELTTLRKRTSGALERADYRLRMDLFDAEIGHGVPSVPQPTTGVTQYSRWEWAAPDLLEPAAARGSLCCRLFFESGS